MNEKTLTWKQVAAWRLRRQRLDRRVPRAEMLDVTTAICGLHAQLMSSAELTLWARVDDLEPDTVARALWEERSLVKTWAMRGTLHLLPSAEFGTWAAALNTRRDYLKPYWLRNFGVTREELERLLNAVNQALDGRELTRQELVDEVTRRTGSPAIGDKLRHGWGVFLKPSASRGELCFAPSAGQNVRFARPDQWLGPFATIDGTDALREVTRRFLAANGPATRDDLARWWGTQAAPAGKLLASLGDDLAPVTIDGVPHWMLAEKIAEAATAQTPGVVRLLPAFDQYVVAASRHAGNLMPGDFRARVFRSQGWLSPVLLVDGRMEGVWRHERKGRRLVVQIEPFAKQPGWVRAAAEAEAERLAGFLGGELELGWQVNS
ncbi:MAG: winged helix DNA-binding domain-containing protein [Thermomicrobiales bacterium]